MDATAHELIMGLASNSPFLGWMIYSYIQTNKQLEKTREDSKKEMKELRLEQKTEEQEIRNKFEVVITGLNQDRKQLVESFSSRIDSLERGQKKIFVLLNELAEVKTKVQELAIKDRLQKEIS
tara:strand:+ start:663 stop:1031 length:369 start_codon:yes stop_codon:yes gene_type:complete